LLDEVVGGRTPLLCPEKRAATTDRPTTADPGPGGGAAIAPLAARLHDGAARIRRNSMAKLFICRFCVAELTRVELADGTAALVCVDCDAIGLAHEIAHGALMWPAGLSADARATDKRRSRRRARRQGAADGR
jgi:hypothetical protein